MNRNTWQILDVGSIWMKEFASALAAIVPIVAWEADMRSLGALQRWQREQTLLEPPLHVMHYPLQRGYSHTAVRLLYHFEAAVLRQLRSRTADPRASPLICSTPFYAPVAERWPGPVVYYVTDLTAGYAGLDSAQVRGLDKRMCRVAAAVCPNSRRIAAYLENEAGCPPAKISVVPNATRAGNIAAEPLLIPQALPQDIAHLRRPIAGVIGNLAANMDWELLAAAIQGSPYLTWVFVGPTTMPVAEPAQARARAWVMEHARFTGPKPYGELQGYARCFDVAVLPYRSKEPTYSGSSTRFYEHLAACRPMLATRGFAELLEKPPLLILVDTADEMLAALADLNGAGYRDGLEHRRWEASLQGTWEARAQSILAALDAAP